MVRRSCYSPKSASVTSICQFGSVDLNCRSTALFWPEAEHLGNGRVGPGELSEERRRHQAALARVPIKRTDRPLDSVPHRLMDLPGFAEEGEAVELKPGEYRLLQYPTGQRDLQPSGIPLAPESIDKRPSLNKWPAWRFARNPDEVLSKMAEEGAGKAPPCCWFDGDHFRPKF